MNENSCNYCFAFVLFLILFLMFLLLLFFYQNPIRRLSMCGSCDNLLACTEIAYPPNRDSPIIKIANHNSNLAKYSNHNMLHLQCHCAWFALFLRIVVCSCFVFFHFLNDRKILCRRGRLMLMSFVLLSLHNKKSKSILLYLFKTSFANLTCFHTWHYLANETTELNKR